MNDDPYDLDRFVAAQSGVYDTVLGELIAGAERTHWMWFVFPQLKGLGISEMANRYGIVSLEEARAYLEHHILGARLERCTQLIIETRALSLRELLGSPDDLKFRSSMTLFARASVADSCFRLALERWFSGIEDPRTLAALDRYNC